MHARKNIGKVVLDPAAEPMPKLSTPVKTKKDNKEKKTAVIAEADTPCKENSGGDKNTAQEPKQNGSSSQTVS